MLYCFQLYDAYPNIMKILPGPHHTIKANYRRLAAFLGEKTEKHKQDWDPNEPRDYIHAYLTEIEKVGKKCMASETC